MTGGTCVYFDGPIFDGTTLHEKSAAIFEKGVFVGICALSEAPADARQIALGGDILSPGFTDLQVNGGGGIMLGDAPSVDGIARIASAHRSLGTVRILPTLITDRPEMTRKVIAATTKAVRVGVPGIAGLHLEGPHLSVAKAGAHDATLIRPMEEADLRALLDAKAQLPILMVTVAPENVTPRQTQRLSEAGVIVSLGHTAASYEACMTHFEAGARCATHLFNAMSQLGSRAPGLVGAALNTGSVSSGLIADGVHVHPAAMRAAWAGKRGPGQMFLVSDAMAVAGTELDHVLLGGRRVSRKEGELRLEDGTLAGADLTLTRAVSVCVQEVGLGLETALAAATRIPAAFCGLENAGLIKDVTPLHQVIRIKSDLSAAALISGA